MSKSSVSVSAAMSVIDFIQRFQYREIGPETIIDEFHNFKYPKILKRILRLILKNKVPNLSVAYQGSPAILPFITACTDHTDATTRMKSVLDAIKTGSDCKSILMNNGPLHYKEVKFYSDLFSGCRFGFSDRLLAEICDVTTNSSDEPPVSWMKPHTAMRCPTADEMQFPVYVEQKYVGSLFKALVDKTSDEPLVVIYDEVHHRDCTAKFEQLCFALLRVCPKDKQTCVDFMLAAGQRVDANIASELSHFRGIIMTDSPRIQANNDDVFILDMYYGSDDEKPLSVRKERVSKLVDKLQARGVSVHDVGRKQIDDPADLEPYVRKLMSKTHGVIIKQASSKYEQSTSKKWWKIPTPQTCETVLITDYGYKIEPFRVEFISGLTASKKHIVISHSSYDTAALARIVQNIVGKRCRVQWRMITNNAGKQQYAPVLIGPK